MASDHGTTGNNRLDALRQKEAALRELIAEEKIRLERRKQKDHLRHSLIVGTCLLAQFEQDPNMGRLLEETLQRFSNPRDAEFLRTRGWRI
jgi:hypothetical protein